jgi:hypothetical protein
VLGYQWQFHPAVLQIGQEVLRLTWLKFPFAGLPVEVNEGELSLYYTLIKGQLMSFYSYI